MVRSTAPHKPHSLFDLFRISVFENDGATPHDAYADEMDMIGTGHILDIAPHRPHYAFDMFRVFMLKMDDDDFVTDVSHDAISIEGAFDSVNLPLSFNTMSVAPLLRSDPIGRSKSDPGCSVTNYYKLRTLSLFIHIMLNI